MNEESNTSLMNNTKLNEDELNSIITALESIENGYSLVDLNRQMSFEYNLLSLLDIQTNDQTQFNFQPDQIIPNEPIHERHNLNTYNNTNENYNNRVNFNIENDEEIIFDAEDIIFNPNELEDIVVPLPEPLHHYGMLKHSNNNILSRSGQNNETVVCNICYPIVANESEDDIENIRAKSWYHLLCGHDICKDCAKTWFSTNKRCPFCRQDLHDLLTKLRHRI